MMPTTEYRDFSFALQKAAAQFKQYTQTEPKTFMFSILQKEGVFNYFNIPKNLQPEITTQYGERYYINGCTFIFLYTIPKNEVLPAAFADISDHATPKKKENKHFWRALYSHDKHMR